MSGSGIDEDMMIGVGAGVLAVVFLVMAVRSFARRRFVAGIAWLLAAAVPGFVAYFFATFEMRMF